jgi:hypothetical protein
MAWYMCNFCAVQYQRVSQNGGTHKNQNSLTIYVTILLVIVTSTVWNNHTSYFNFPIVNFLFTCSNIPAAPAYGVYNSQLIRYSIACGSYQDFLDRGLLLTGNLLNQGFLLVKLKSSLRKFYGCHHDLVDRYGISVSQNTMDMFYLS